MATIIKTGNGYNHSLHMEFQISSEDELTSLPSCAPGSFAYLDDLSKLWMLNAEKTWVEI